VEIINRFSPSIIFHQGEGEPGNEAFLSDMINIDHLLNVSATSWDGGSVLTSRKQ